MKVTCLFVFATCCFLLTPQSSMGQSSDQSLRELVTEIRQLRATLQRMNAAAYKGQVMLERLKLQQEQVARLSRELREVRENISETRSQQFKMREVMSRIETGVESGIKNPNDVAGLKAEMEAVSQREQRLANRETQLASELEAERAKLNELNDRLNALIELEMSPR